MEEEEDPAFAAVLKHWHATYTTYAIGFALSILLTLTAFFLVMKKVLSGTPLVLTILVLAVAQAIVQLLFFLHIKTGEKPNWNLRTFLFMVLVLLIVLLGTVWIMHSLDVRTMPNMGHGS